MPRAMSDKKEERTHNINLRVQDISLPLRVLSTEEADYRRGAEELNLTLSLYRERFPLQEGQPASMHLAMAAVDVARRWSVWKRSATTRNLEERLSSLAERSERVWIDHQSLLHSLQRDFDRLGDDETTA